MSIGSKTIASVLDIIFGDTFIATIYNSDRFFNLIFDLIILACYIYMFKHFCSFLTNILASMLNFDGQGFAKNTGQDGTSGFFDEKSGGILDQFIGATGYKTIERSTSNFIKNTAGLRTLDKYTGISKFSILGNDGKFSLRSTFKNGFNVIKKTGGSIYDKAIGDDLKKFLEIRKEGRDKKASTIKDLDVIVGDNKYMQNLVEEINNDKISNVERMGFKTRFDLIINENIRNNLRKYNLNNNQEEFKKNLDLAVERKLITESEKEKALKGEALTLKSNDYSTESDSYKFYKGIHASGVFSPTGLGRSIVNFAEKSLLLNSIVGTNKEKNLRNISELAKLSKRGLFDLRNIGAENIDINKLINGTISKDEYDKIMAHVRAIGLGTSKYNIERKINRDVTENVEAIRGANYDADTLKSLINISNNSKSIDREINGRIGLTEDNVNNEIDSLKKDIIDKIKHEEGEDSQQIKAEDITLVGTDLKTENGEIIIGYTDEGNILYITGVDEIGVGTGNNELMESLKNDKIDMGAATENIEKSSGELTQSDEQTIKHGKAMLKVNNLKIKLAEYNASNITDENEKREEQEKIEELKNKNKKIERREKHIKAKSKK